VEEFIVKVVEEICKTCGVCMSGRKFDRWYGIVAEIQNWFVLDRKPRGEHRSLVPAGEKDDEVHRFDHATAKVHGLVRSRKKGITIKG
jgi:hypothetical protein